MGLQRFVGRSSTPQRLQYFRGLPSLNLLLNTLEPKLLYLPQKRLAVTSSAIVVLTAFLDSPNLSKEGLSGLKGKLSWRIPKFDNI